MLLEQPVNAFRLMQAVAELRTPTAEGVPIVGDLSSVLRIYRSLAAEAHRGQGRPVSKRPLTVAYKVLVDFWIAQHGRDSFTSDWHQGDNGSLAPVSDAACFIYEAMQIIDPHRPDLAKELRVLMRHTVSRLSGPRRGRGLLSA